LSTATTNSTAVDYHHKVVKILQIPSIKTKNYREQNENRKIGNKVRDRYEKTFLNHRPMKLVVDSLKKYLKTAETTEFFKSTGYLKSY